MAVLRRFGRRASYTVPQDHTTFTLLRHRSAALWLDQAAAIEREYGFVECLSHPDRGYLGDRDKRAIYGEFLAGVANGRISGARFRATSHHNSSDTTHGATAIDTPPSSTTDTDSVRRQHAGPFSSVRALTAPIPNASILDAVRLDQGGRTTGQSKDVVAGSSEPLSDRSLSGVRTRLGRQQRVLTGPTT